MNRTTQMTRNGVCRSGNQEPLVLQCERAKLAVDAPTILANLEQKMSRNPVVLHGDCRGRRTSYAVIGRIVTSLIYS